MISIDGLDDPVLSYTAGAAMHACQHGTNDISIADVQTPGCKQKAQ